MRLVNKVFGDADARRTHAQAKEELDRISRKDCAETDAFVAANRRVIDAEKNLPRWRRIGG